MSLSPRELRIFVALANSLSFTSVAEQFFVTQPTMSKIVSDIEEKIGIKLFERTTRNVSLTSEGRDLLGIATKIVSDLDDGLAELNGAARLHNQKLNIAALPTLAARLLPPHITKLELSEKGLKIKIHDTYTEAAIDLLRTRQVDLAFLDLDVTHKDMNYKEILSEPYVLLTSKEHSNINYENCTLVSLSKLQIISMPKGTATRRQSEAAFFNHGLTFNPKLEFFHLTSIAEFVKAGAGVALLPLFGAKLIMQPELKIIHFKGAPTRTVGLVTRKDYVLSKTAESLVNLIKDSL